MANEFLIIKIYHDFDNKYKKFILILKKSCLYDSLNCQYSIQQSWIYRNLLILLLYWKLINLVIFKSTFVKYKKIFIYINIK